MPDATLRQITLLELLPRRAPGLTTVELRNRLYQRGFKIHLRSVQRDLDRLSAHFGFTNDECNPPRWFWPPGAADLTSPPQDPHSALTWQLIEQYLEPALPLTIKRRAEPQFSAARRVLKESCAAEARRWSRRVRFVSRGIPLKPPDIEEKVMDAVHTALLDAMQLNVAYQARGTGGTKIFRFHPLGLVIRESVYYLIGTANEHANVIQLALHRISQAEVLSEQVTEPASFNLDRYIEEGGFLYSYGGKIKLVLRLDAYTAQHLQEAPITEDQKTRLLNDGRVELQATVLDSQQLRWWILGFGDKVEVIKPEPLRKWLRGQFAALHNLYS